MSKKNNPPTLTPAELDYIENGPGHDNNGARAAGARKALAQVQLDLNEPLDLLKVVTTLRSLVRKIDEMPCADFNEPLEQLARGLHSALESYGLATKARKIQFARAVRSAVGIRK